jgi:hypothetical protein
MIKLQLDEALFIEGKYIDPECTISDYGTGHIVKGDDIFDDRTHVPFYDQLFTNPDYMAREENLKGHIVMMSPREYYQNCAYRIFNSSVESLKHSRSLDSKVNDRIREIITKYKRKVFLPYLNYAEKNQEGLHRMLVAAELFGWDHEFPVLIVEWADEQRAFEQAIQKQRDELRRHIRNAVDKALKYNYTELADFENELKYHLDYEFEWIDEPVRAVSVKHEADDTTYVTVNDVTYSFATRAINIEEVSEDDDFNIEDIDNIEFTEEELLDMDNLSLDDFLRKYG